jgi:hypothetical protein
MTAMPVDIAILNANATHGTWTQPSPFPRLGKDSSTNLIALR